VNFEDLLAGPAGPSIVRRAFDVLKKIQRVQGTETNKTLDSAPANSQAVKASMYAQAINQAGRLMRREKDCRSGLRRSAIDAEPQTIEPSQEQRLEAFKAAEQYAEQCRSRWRKG
jgi:hypothetical protein